MMDLITDVPLKEIRQEPDRFDFLQDVKDDLLKVCEVHPNASDDSTYVWLLWCKPESTIKVLGEVDSYLREARAKVHIVGEGLVIVEEDVS